MELKNKIVFISGASSGIGAACALRFAELGAKLLLCARNLEKLNETVKNIQEHYPVAVHAFALDVRDHAAVNQTLSSLKDEWRDVDVVINNAGLAAGLETLQDGNVDDWEIMIDTNIKGLLYVTKFMLPTMLAKNSGHIFNIGSIAGHQTYAKGAVYCATKFAVNALTQGLRMDLFGTNIRVTTIDPGAVETNFSLVRFKGDAERASQVYEGMQPLTPDDIADAIIYSATRKPHINISEMIIMPTAQAAATMIARKT